MSKIEELTPINASYGGINKLNAHLQKIETAFQNTLSRDGSSPNHMLANIDMNSNQLINLGEPVLAYHAATKAYVDELLASVDGYIAPDPVESATLQFSTMAEATASVDLTNGLAYYVQGRVSATGGGGGWFRYVSGSSATINTGTTFGVAAPLTGRLIRIGYHALEPEMFGAIGDGTTVDTTALDDMATVAQSSQLKRISFGPKRYKYEGTGMVLKGYLWDIYGCGRRTELYRTTDGPFFIYDFSTESGGVSRIGNFRALSNLANGVRPNTRVCKTYSNLQTYRLNDVTWHNINASGLHDIIWMDKTFGDPYLGYDQLGRYFGHNFENIVAEGTSGSQCYNGIVWSAGTGSHHRIFGCSLAVLNLSIMMGDGDQPIHDTTIVGCHLLGAVGGFRGLGPTNPLYFRNSNICLVGNQFDGNGTYTWSVENIGRFRIRTNNSLSGVGPVVTNIIAPYDYEDHLGGQYSHLREVPNIASAVNRLSLEASATGSAVKIEAVGDDADVSIGLTPKGAGVINLKGGSPFVSSSNGIRTAGVRRELDTDVLKLAGGSTLNSGAHIELAGGTHASVPNQAFHDALLHSFRSQSGASTYGTLGSTGFFLNGALDLGHASDTTITRKSAGIAQIEAYQLATVGPKVFRTSQYCVNTGTPDDYTAFNNLHTTAVAANAVIVVDGLVRLGTNMTLIAAVVVEGGGFSIDAARVLTINGEFAAGRFQAFQGSGTVTWDSTSPDLFPEWWGVKSTVVSGYTSSANLAAVNAMHASVAAGTYGVDVKWANKQYVFSGGWTSIQRNSVVHSGVNGATLGTWFIFENTTGDDITYLNCQHGVVQNITFWPLVKKTAGFAVKMDGVYRGRIQNCNFSYGWNAFEIDDSTECCAFNNEFRFLMGTRGINFTGSSGAGSYRLLVTNQTANNPWPQVVNPTPANVKGSWATATGYILGDIVVANGRLWQCTTAGTSAAAGTGPSAIPGSTAQEAFTSTVADNTAAWKFVASNELTWICQDNYAYSLAVNKGSLVNGAYALRMIDTAATGSSYPIWMFVDGVDTDHTYYSGIVGTRGEGVYVTQAWLGSSLSGHGATLASTHRGEGSFTNCRVLGNANHGILISAPGVIVNGNQIGKNSTASSGTYHGVAVSANVNRFVIGNNMLGGLVGGGAEGQGYGVFVAVGTSDNYTITNNVCNGNVTGTVSDGGVGVNKTVSGNVA